MGDRGRRTPASTRAIRLSGGQWLRLDFDGDPLALSDEAWNLLGEVRRRCNEFEVRQHETFDDGAGI